METEPMLPLYSNCLQLAARPGKTDFHQDHLEDEFYERFWWLDREACEAAIARREA